MLYYSVSMSGAGCQEDAIQPPPPARPQVTPNVRAPPPALKSAGFASLLWVLSAALNMDTPCSLFSM